MSENMRSLGVAISGGGHRAALWGLGVLLYLVDAGMSRDVRVISSVSGGSITNGVVAKRMNFQSPDTTPDTFRAHVQPLVTHITNDGLFFYGSATNGYLWGALVLATLSAASWLLALTAIVTQITRFLLDLVGVCACPQVETVPAWVAGLAVTLAFTGLGVGAAKYSEKPRSVVTLIAIVVVAIGLAPLIARLLGGQESRLSLKPGLPMVVALALLLTALTLLLFARRSRVAQQAMDHEHFGGVSLDGFRDGDVPVPHHVICATELQSGLHAYFTNRFIYSYEFGISRDTSSIRLAQAVQSSAALPGGFAPQRIDTKGLSFVSPESGQQTDHPEQPMILVDGGVYDNMAEQWFVGLHDRRERWTATMPKSGSTFASLLEDADQVIIANASTGWRWRPYGSVAARLSLIARETQSLGRAQEIMYNTIGRRRRAHLYDLWEQPNGAAKGTFVEVDQNPRDQADDDPELCQKLDLLGLSDSDWSDIVSASRTYPTVLRRVKPTQARAILWHAYTNTAVAAALHLGRPIPDHLTLPKLEEFAVLDERGGLRLLAPKIEVTLSEAEERADV